MKEPILVLCRWDAIYLHGGYRPPQPCDAEVARITIISPIPSVITSCFTAVIHIQYNRIFTIGVGCTKRSIINRNIGVYNG